MQCQQGSACVSHCTCLVCIPAEMVAAAARLGEEGDVDGALAATRQAEALGAQHDAMHKTMTDPERTMSVCEVCGIFISVEGDGRRLVRRPLCVT